MILLGLACVSGFLSAFAADPLTESLQKGLLEEEVNRDPNAAAKAYESAVQQADAQRPAAATAVFRLAESYRKLGKTNDAVAQYQRILDQFGDQATLAALSRTNLVQLGVPAFRSVGGTAGPAAGAGKTTFEARLLAIQLARIEQLKGDPEQQAHAVLALSPDEGLRRMLQHLPKLREQAAFARTNETVKKIAARSPKDPEGAGSAEVELELRPREPAPYLEKQVATQLTMISQRVEFILKTQQARLLALETEAGLASGATGSGAALTPAAQRQKELIEQELALVEEQIKNKQLLVESGRAPRDELVTLQREALSLKRQMAALESQVRRDLLEVPLPAKEATAGPAAPTVDPADVESLREELKLVEQELQATRKKLENGKAEEAEVRRAQRESLRLQRKLPENAGKDRQIALLQDELKLTEEGLTEVRKKIEVGAAAPLDEVPLRRELLAVQRELAAVQRSPSVPAAAGGSDISAPATKEEADEIKRIQAIIKDSPDLVNAHNANPTGGTPLHKAAASGYVAVAEFLLANRADVKAQDNEGSTPLHLAAAAGHKRLCELLLAKGADVNAANESGYTPLHRAVLGGYQGVAETLLAAGAQANSKGYVPPVDRQPQQGTANWMEMETSPLHSTAEKGFVALTELLLKNGADINAQDRGGRTPLIRAVLKNQPATVKVLLEKGADANPTDATGNTALGHAVGRQTLPLAQLLLDYKADLETRVRSDRADQEGEWTVLFDPVGRGQVEATRLLLDRGANVNARADSGITPLHWAVIQNAPATLKLLLERKADLTLRDTGGNLPLHYALEYPRLPHIQALLAAGADPNAPGWAGGEEKSWPPLLRVVMPEPARWPDTMAEVLLKHGADVNAKLTNGWTALHQAVRFNRSDLAEVLVANKADLNARGSIPKGEPVLGERRAEAGAAAATPGAPAGLPGGIRSIPTRAIRSTQPGVPMPPPGSFAPLNFGHQPLPADKEVTPLHVAVASQNLQVAKFLLEHGADVNARDAEARTPLHFAIKYRDLEILRLLLDAQADPNAKDSVGWTPLRWAADLPAQSEATGFGHANRGVVMLAEGKDIIALLREHGAKTVLSDPKAITVSRSSTGYSARVLTRGARDWNQYTLFELLAVQYGLLQQSGLQPSGAQPASRRPPRVSAFGGAPTDPLAFPDLARLRISRPRPDGAEQVIAVNLSTAVKGQDCRADVALEWGDVVEIPEEDHPLNQVWGVSDELRATLKQCLERKVQIRVKGETQVYELKMPFRHDSDLKQWVFDRSLYGWDVPTTLERSGLLRTSSDRARVMVRRVDPATGALRSWRVDCTSPGDEPGFWLRDGDMIEVPDKADAAPAGAGVVRILGEVKRPGTVALESGARKDIIDAVAECGGLTEMARERIEFTRAGTTRSFTLDALKAEADPSKKIWLEPGDTIEVKRKVL